MDINITYYIFILVFKSSKQKSFCFSTSKQKYVSKKKNEKLVPIVNHTNGNGIDNITIKIVYLNNVF